MDLLKFMMELGLALFGLEKYDAIYNRIRYLTSQKVELMLLLVIMQKNFCCKISNKNLGC